jgi:pyridoxamine 5'-phosphate oxidase
MQDSTRDEIDDFDHGGDPYRLFAHWFEAASAEQPHYPEAMTLSTADASGDVSSRTVLMKDFGADQGFVFFTKLKCLKARQIEVNPRVSLTFWWAALERQVVVRGSATRLSTARVARYFLTRPRGSQLAAWFAPEGRRIGSRAELAAAFDEIKQRFANGEVPLPSHWGGFRVDPTSIEFLQMREYRLHDRFLFERETDGRAGEAGWRLSRLTP